MMRDGVIEAISARAAAQPDSPAIVGLAETMTFRQLDELSNRLARHLQARGATLETPVGLYTQRSPAFIVGALAILKAGAAYVPFDQACPPLRIGAILRDCGAPLLLSHHWMAAGLPSGPWAAVDLDVERQRIEACSAAALPAAHTSDSLAYVIYTSGSTGAPKGVEVTHGNLAHLIDWHRRAYGVTPRDRASQIAGLGFDAAVWEIWCHLAAGASLHLIDETSRLSAETLRDWLLHREITIAFVPTLMAEQLLALDWPDGSALRTLLTGADTLRRYPRSGLPFHLVNHYGPTECTVLVTAGVVPPGEPRAELPTIGRPIEGMEIRVLNEKLQPVAAGEAGELCVAGPQVARGYRGQAPATAEKFVAQSDVPGGRLYRTGDRVRLLPNGELAFLGRLDSQIKIRGYRVEPDEIAAQLNRHPDVRSSAVIARADHAGDLVLTAYLLLAPGARLSAPALRRFLAPQLANYMIPAAFVRVDTLPVNANGKCDREALPPPGPDNLLPEGEVAPASGAPASGVPGCGTPARGAVRPRLSALVGSLMGLAEVHPDDNFFLIGGHSLMAAQLVAKVHDQFGVRLTLRQLFEAPTIGLLADAIDRSLPGAGR